MDKDFLEISQLSVGSIFCTSSAKNYSNPLLGSVSSAGIALSAALSLLSITGFIPNPLLCFTLIFTACGLIAASIITLAHESIFGSSACFSAIKALADATVKFSNESFNWNISCTAQKQASNDISSYVCALAKSPIVFASSDLDTGLSTVIAAGILAFLCTTVFSPSFKPKSSFIQNTISAISLVTLAFISFSLSSRLASLFFSLLSVISGKSETLSADAYLFVAESFHFFATFIFRADISNVLASLSLFSRVILPAAWLVSDGASAFSGAVVFLVAAVSILLVCWRFTVVILHGTFFGDPLAMITLGTQKSFLLILVQYLTGLPAHSSLLLPLFYILDADLSWKAIDSRRRLWRSSLSSTKMNIKYTPSLFFSPLYRARLSYLGVSAVFILSVAAFFWGISLILFGDVGGMSLHGLRLALPGSSSQPQSRMFSKWSASSGGDRSIFPVCQNVTNLVQAWGIPQDDDSDIQKNVFASVAVSLREKVSIWFQATIDALTDLVVIALAGRTDQCRMTKVSSAGVIACGALRGLLAVSRVSLLAMTAFAGLLIKVLELAFSTILPFISRLIGNSYSLPSLSTRHLTMLNKIFHDREGFFDTLPVHLAALDDHSLSPIGVLRIFLLLSGIHLLVRGPPTEGLQRTLRKILSSLTFNNENGAARTARRIKEQKEAYSNDATNSLQDVFLAIPALSAAFVSFALVGFTVGVILTGGLDLFPLDSFDLMHIPRQLTGVIVLLFVASCVLPRHISNEIIRAPIALSHSVVGALVLTAALIVLKDDKASTYAVFNQSFQQLCARVSLSKDSSFIANIVFLVLAFAGISHKTVSFLNLVEPGVKSFTDDADEDDDAEVERAVQRARSIANSSTLRRSEAIDLTDPVPPSLTSTVLPAKFSSTSSSARRGSVSAVPSRSTPLQDTPAKVNESAPGAVSVASVVEGVANLARKMALEHERKLAEQERERKVAEILKKAEEEILAANAAAAAVVLGGGSIGPISAASPSSFSALQRQRRGSDAYLSSKAAMAATTEATSGSFGGSWSEK